MSAWVKIRTLASACVLAALVLGLTGGCASTRFTTTIQRVPDADKAIPVKVRIAKVIPPPPFNRWSLATTTGGAYAPGTLDANTTGEGASSFLAPDVFQKNVSETAVQRYPEVFTLLEDGLPIGVRVDARHGHCGFGPLFPVLEICTLCVAYGIVGGPFIGASEFKVTVVDARGNAGPVVAFRRKDVTWMTVLTPLGLLPVPGHSDADRVSGLGDPSPRSYQVGGRLTVEGCVDAIVAALKQMDPGFLRQAAAEQQRSVEKARRAALRDSPGKIEVQGSKITVALAPLESGSLSAGEMRALTEKLRAAVMETEYFIVVTREDMNKILQEQGFTRQEHCSSTECLIEMGQLLSARKMIGGSLEKLGTTYVLALRLIDVETGKVDYMAEKDVIIRSEDEKGLLLREIRGLGRELILKRVEQPVQ